MILTALCGHGHLDLPAYDAYLSGQVVDHAWEDADIQAAVADALSRLPTLAPRHTAMQANSPRSTRPSGVDAQAAVGLASC